MKCSSASVYGGSAVPDFDLTSETPAVFIAPFTVTSFRKIVGVTVREGNGRYSYFVARVFMRGFFISRDFRFVAVIADFRV